MNRIAEDLGEPLLVQARVVVFFLFLRPILRLGRFTVLNRELNEKGFDYGKRAIHIFAQTAGLREAYKAVSQEVI